MSLPGGIRGGDLVLKCPRILVGEVELRHNMLYSPLYNVMYLFDFRNLEWPGGRSLCGNQ